MVRRLDLIFGKLTTLWSGDPILGIAGKVKEVQVG